ncbi:MAG TPA: EAL domain-containing protein [Acidobacteriaceae bacterium]|jgi:EAL domain-containing protein (putative c-di-GMP-specific phosphodiesterase class I)|nr:EAL domain-containing protein [Acidobacteriaceae bacterium]
MNAQSQITPDPTFTFAFQPIVDGAARAIVAWEALIRGPWDEPAWQVLNQVAPTRLHLFDQNARGQAIVLAARLGLDRPLHLNFLPRSLHTFPNTVLATIESANEAHVPLERIVLEVPESEVIDDRPRLVGLLSEYRSLGLGLAIDDFGAAYASLSLLAELEPDQIKLDMRLIRGIDRHPPRQALVRAILQASADLHIHVIAEGVETTAEFAWLFAQKIRLFQGYLFARPAFESFPAVNYPVPELEAGEPKRPAGSAERIAAGRGKRLRP